MKSIIMIVLSLLTPASITCAEFRPDPVKAFVASQPDIAVDLSIPNKNRSPWIKTKGWNK